MEHKTEWDFIPKNAAEQCATCKKHIPFTLTCKAYPKQILEEIMFGEKTCEEHEKKDPVPGIKHEAQSKRQ